MKLILFFAYLLISIELRAQSCVETFGMNYSGADELCNYWDVNCSTGGGAPGTKVNRSGEEGLT